MYKDRSVSDVSDTAKDKIKEYIDQMNDLEKIAYEISKTRLKSSFDIEKSIGYKKWLKS